MRATLLLASASAAAAFKYTFNYAMKDDTQSVMQLTEVRLLPPARAPPPRAVLATRP